MKDEIKDVIFIVIMALTVGLLCVSGIYYFKGKNREPLSIFKRSTSKETIIVTNYLNITNVVKVEKCAIPHVTGVEKTNDVICITVEANGWTVKTNFYNYAY